MRAVARFRARFESRAAILLYHRVADPRLDPWSLAVRPVNFDSQLETIRKRFTVLPLAQLLASLEQHQLPRRAAVVTFDDGYADNLLEAEPLLRRHGIPATIFVTSGALTETREFWWDELEQIVLSGCPLPAALSLPVGDQVYQWDRSDRHRDDEHEARRHGGWRAWQPPPSRRHALFLELWRLLRPLPLASTRAALDALARWAGHDSRVRPSHRPLTPDEVRTLAAAPHIEIGTHTVTHPRLSMLAEAAQRAEIADSRRYLEQTIGRPVTTFSYPFGGPGDYTQRTVAAARESGLACACTTTAGPVRHADDPYELRRCMVPDLAGSAFEDWLDSRIEAA